MNNNMRDLLDLINEMSEDQGNAELHDEFDIELSEDTLIESGIIDINEDGILIECDDKAIELLEQHGLILEETDWSKYDEPTISRIKKGTAKPVDKTDYDKPAYQRKKEKKKQTKRNLMKRWSWAYPVTVAQRSWVKMTWTKPNIMARKSH